MRRPGTLYLALSAHLKDPSMVKRVLTMHILGPARTPLTTALSTYLFLTLTSACFLQAHVEREQMDCHLTRTTAETHKMIQDNLAETPVYGGWVDSKGPRYCPSIEDKIVRFADKQSHQVIPTL